MEVTKNLHAFLWNSPSANNCNSYLISSKKKRILIDPGHAPYFDHVRSGLHQLGLSIEDIDLVICTHAHPDHIEAVGLFDRSRSLFVTHAEEWKLLREKARYLSASTHGDASRFTPDFFLKGGNLKVGDIGLEVYHTPGHTPGSVTLRWKAAKALFTGDLIFRDGLGRTDLPGGDSSQLKDSVRKMAALDAQFMLSGHGPAVAGAAAVKANFKRVEQVWFKYL